MQNEYPQNLYYLEEMINNQTSLIKELSLQVNELISQRLEFISLTELSTSINKSNQTLKYHLITNYEPEKDFKKVNGKIYVNSQIAPQIRSYYEKK